MQAIHCQSNDVGESGQELFVVWLVLFQNNIRRFGNSDNGCHKWILWLLMFRVLCADFCWELDPNEWVYSWRSKPLDVRRVRILIDLCWGLFVWNFVFEETIYNVSQFPSTGLPVFSLRSRSWAISWRALVLFDFLFPASRALVNSLTFVSRETIDSPSASPCSSSPSSSFAL